MDFCTGEKLYEFPLKKYTFCYYDLGAPLFIRVLNRDLAIVDNISYVKKQEYSEVLVKRLAGKKGDKFEITRRKKYSFVQNIEDEEKHLIWHFSNNRTLEVYSLHAN